MKVGIDSYCYHRFLGDVYPEQQPPAATRTASLNHPCIGR